MLLDLLSKLWFFENLYYGEEWLNLGNTFKIQLTINPLAFSDAMIANRTPESISAREKWYYLLGGFSLVLMGGYIALIYPVKHRRMQKYLLGMLLYIILFSLSSLLARYLPGVPPKSSLVSVMLMTKIFLPVYFFTLFTQSYLKAAFAILIASNVGNLLSFTYYPYHVIDFMYLRPLNQHFGVGIFNFADVYGYIFLVLIIIYGVVALGRYLWTDPG
ncbi:MAG: hypothetical protein HC880_19935 [Bacteroidia bacterium]|nr:hypothetical protein [Bacteroidia bacterium]